MSTEEYIKFYTSLGWSICPLYKIGIDSEGKKSPRFAHSWGELQKRHPDKNTIDSWVKSSSKYNALAVLTGRISGVVVVDIDEVDQSRYPFLNSPLRVRTANSGGVHYYFKYTPKLDVFTNAVEISGMPMDYRGNGGVAFLPGSRVEGVGEYTLIDIELEDIPRILESLPELPSEVFVMMQEKKKEVSGETKYLKDSGLVVPEFSEGGRNHGATSFTGAILRGIEPELWGSVGWDYLQLWNQEKVDPPLSTRELRSIFESISGKEHARRVDSEIFFEASTQDFSAILEKQIQDQKNELFTTGYKEVDEKIGGFVYSNAYLVSGLEKSGKSSWLMKMLQMKLDEGVRMGFVNTELSIYEFTKRMTAYQLNKVIDDVSDDEIRSWAKKYSDGFEYIGVENMGSMESMLSTVEKFVENNIECLVFDNLTSWSTKMVQGKEPWQVMSELMQKLINFTKKNKIVTLMVAHVRPSAVVTTSTPRVTELAKDPGIIFEKSMTYIRRPSISDIYGGGAALSQISGAVIIWRPYQKFPQKVMSGMSRILLESIRHAGDHEVVADFDAPMALFVEQSQQDKHTSGSTYEHGTS